MSWMVYCAWEEPRRPCGTKLSQITSGTLMQRIKGRSVYIREPLPSSTVYDPERQRTNATLLWRNAQRLVQIKKNLNGQWKVGKCIHKYFDFNAYSNHWETILHFKHSTRSTIDSISTHRSYLRIWPSFVPKYIVRSMWLTCQCLQPARPGEGQTEWLFVRNQNKNTCVHPSSLSISNHQSQFFYDS